MTNFEYKFKLLLNAILLDWRSRQGFMRLLSLGRLLVWGAIGIRFFLIEKEPAPVNVVIVWAIYFFFSFWISFAVFFYPHFRRFGIMSIHVFSIILDVAILNFFIFQSGNPNSDLFLLLLLPLVTISHYFHRKLAVVLSLAVITSYFITIHSFTLIAENNYPLSLALKVLITRTFFLLGATWVFRIQSNVPNIDDRKITSPTRVKTQIESRLKNFNQAVAYDTISVMLMYRDNLHIIACHGFDNPQDINKLEFPVNDPRYPNSQVIKSKFQLIADPSMYPSFKDESYSASHVRSWLGVPLISLATGECFGMIGIDSAQENAFTSWDARKAGWFAASLSNFLMEAQLGPAALTQSTKRENLVSLLEKWSSLLSHDSAAWEDDIQAAHALAKFGKDLFQVEDCSIYFLRQKVDKYNNKERVLHLIASSAVPGYFFGRHEIRVTGKPGDGLTGRAVNNNRTINLGAKEIKNSPYLTGFTGHLDFLFSKRSRQIIITPFRDSNKRPQGAIKLENRMGQSTETRFSPSEEHIFAVFVAMAGLIIENIRQKNFNNRQMQSIHNLRGIMHPAGIKPLDDMLAEAGVDGKILVSQNNLLHIREMVNYSKSVLDGFLAVSTGKFTLENEGLLPAIQNYIDTLSNSIPTFKSVCDLIHCESDPNTRDELPHRIRIAYFNIAREAIINIVRHSGIEQIENGYARLRFYKEKDTFHLTIEDNGKGFVLKNVNKGRHSFGLEDMYFQKDSILQICKEAKLEINSQVGYGTLIHLTATHKGEF